ncbi:hypothetical protein GALMADRAFT_69570 [Galerina marginata CBS 339.88]|uniref:Uncharacterized protein n=1 Tax=Galerina marginata (strain CBS 339.88) TaxID=685588 RepID=A0A067T543_GALM3|nr:hypothetical protein GALMADRAFT_69570 [Galerina marginata CBS 339.88]
MLDLQHNMSSQTFKVHVALGSWAKTPIFSKFSELTRMVNEAMRFEPEED